MSKCQNCQKNFSRGKYYPDTGWICEDCLGYKLKMYNDWVPQRIKDERQKYKKDLIQPYREGEFSKEFKEAYPSQTAGMIKEGVITKKQAKEAKNVWS